MPSRTDLTRRFGDTTGRLFQIQHREKMLRDQEEIEAAQLAAESEAAKLTAQKVTDASVIYCMCKYGAPKGHPKWVDDSTAFADGEPGAAPPPGYRCEYLRADQLQAARRRDNGNGNGHVDSATVKAMQAELRELRAIVTQQQESGTA